jgi:hypothetical protein
VIGFVGRSLCGFLLCHFQISEALKHVLAPSDISHSASTIGSPSLPSNVSSNLAVDPVVEFHSLQYALFMTCFVEVMGGFFFLLTALYITWDRYQAERAVAGRRSFKQSHGAVCCVSRVILEGRCTGIVLFESGPVPTDGRSDYAIFISGILRTVWDFRNCNVSCVFGHVHKYYSRLV